MNDLWARRSPPRSSPAARARTRSATCWSTSCCAPPRRRRRDHQRRRRAGRPPAGPLRYGALYETFPFDNRFARVKLRAGDFAAMLAGSLGGGPFFSLGGLQAVAGCDGPDLRVTLQRAGVPLDASQEIVVLASDFLATGGDRAFVGLQERGLATVTLEDDPPLREALAAELGSSARCRSRRSPTTTPSTRGSAPLRAPGPLPLTRPVPPNIFKGHRPDLSFRTASPTAPSVPRTDRPRATRPPSPIRLPKPAALSVPTATHADRERPDLHTDAPPAACNALCPFGHSRRPRATQPSIPTRLLTPAPRSVPSATHADRPRATHLHTDAPPDACTPLCPFGRSRRPRATPLHSAALPDACAATGSRSATHADAAARPVPPDTSSNLARETCWRSLDPPLHVLADLPQKTRQKAPRPRRSSPPSRHAPAPRVPAIASRRHEPPFRPARDLPGVKLVCRRELFGAPAKNTQSSSASTRARPRATRRSHTNLRATIPAVCWMSARSP
ncbi:5'-nucleotidase C-terminal domain-containing protein [Nannocystis pusilla]|uniref:5'-nucleotidase C-terminal domain-containing protein n=1 Tax=Nannocystis pusilla TaxID=889268 RepID=UPI003B7CE223